MKKLIVTADDFGVFPSVNAGVIEAIKLGKVNSVACFSNHSDSVKHVKELIDTVGDKADVGCHLTISSGKALTIANKDGFTKNGHFNMFNELDIDKIEKQLPTLKKELIAQVEVFKDSNIPVKHLSCHHNTLTNTKAMFQVYLEVADHFKIPMRSVNITPAQQDNLYRLSLQAMLLENISFKKNLEIHSFGKEIRKFIVNNPLKVKTPHLLEGSHYGPPPFISIPDITVRAWKKHKHDILKKFMKDFINSSYQHGELMLHLIKKDKKLLDADNNIDYPGVDRKYFDSRNLEFASISTFDYAEFPEVKMSLWGEI